MKKNIKIFLILILTITLCTGCKNSFTFNKDEMDNIKVYTSLYPIEYVTNKLYKNNADITGIYPAGINPYEYKLTKKQISDISNSDLVIYNGLTNEKELVVDMINKNKDLKIIDATARIEYSYDIDEIWINPSNVLTIAQNIKKGLNEYIDSTYLKMEIDDNYRNLNLEISKLDANIKEDIQNATYKTIVASTDNFKVLEKYGLKVYSLDEKSITDKDYNEIVKLISSNQIKYIYSSENSKNNKYILKLKKAYPSLSILNINTLNNISDEDKSNNKDYITIMNDNRDLLKKELYK